MMKIIFSWLMFCGCLLVYHHSEAWWIQWSGDSTCAIAYSMTKHTYIVTEEESASSARLKVKSIKLLMYVRGEEQSKVCENADHCDWLIEEYLLGCHQSCSYAYVEDYEGNTVSMPNNCAG
jgi:hypothetical protein